MLRLLEMTKDGPKGNLFFQTLDDVDKWFFWAGLEIKDRVHDSIDDVTTITAVGHRDRSHSFLIRPVEGNIDEAA